MDFLTNNPQENPLEPLQEDLEDLQDLTGSTYTRAVRSNKEAIVNKEKAMETNDKAEGLNDLVMMAEEDTESKSAGGIMLPYLLWRIEDDSKFICHEKWF